MNSPQASKIFGLFVVLLGLLVVVSVVVHRHSGKVYMRHWSISLKLLLTGDVKSVQADSGQKNTQMVLDRYAHAFVEERKKMAFTVEESMSQMAQKNK